MNSILLFWMSEDDSKIKSCLVWTEDLLIFPVHPPGVRLVAAVQWRPQAVVPDQAKTIDGKIVDKKSAILNCKS